MLCVNIFFMEEMTLKQSAIFNALERVMKPVVRLLLARGISYVQFTDWLKHIFIETAAETFGDADKGINDSRISVITGVHRKDVKRLRELTQTDAELKVPSTVKWGSQLVSTWLNTPSFCNETQPIAIARLRKHGQEISFEALSERITRDVSSRALLDEFVRLGILTIDDKDMVQLVTAAFIPAKGEDEKAYYLGLGVGDHAAAAVSNVLNQQPASFDRLVHYNHFSAQSIEVIEKLSHEHGNLLLQQINTEAEKQHLLSHEQKENGKRFTLGVYFYAGDDRDDNT